MGLDAATARRRLALHEAAHAVAALDHGMGVEDATIVAGTHVEGGRDQPYVGRVRFACGDVGAWVAADPWTRGPIAALQALAGPEASDCVATGDGYGSYCESSDTDIGKAQAWLKKAEAERPYLGPAAPSMDTISRRAHDYVKAHLAEIEALADALLERGTLSGDDVRAIIARVRGS